MFFLDLFRKRSFSSLVTFTPSILRSKPQALHPKPDGASVGGRDSPISWTLSEHVGQTFSGLGGRVQGLGFRLGAEIGRYVVCVVAYFGACEERICAIDPEPLVLL